MWAEVVTAAAPWVVLGGTFVGLVVFAVRSGSRIARSKGESEEANARADFNRKLADRRVAKSLEELADRRRRRHERL